MDAPRSPQVSICPSPRCPRPMQSSSLAPRHTRQCSSPCGVYPFLILWWCAHWWAMEHIQNVFGAVSYYVLKNNKLHTAALLLPLFHSFKATGELKIPSSFQGQHRVQVTTNGRVPRPWSPCLLWRTHSAPAESPLGPSASRRMPPRAPLCRHRQKAAPCWQCGAAPPANRCLLPGPPGLHLLFQMIKHTVLRSSKPPLTPLPHRQENYVIYFMEQSTSLLLFSLPLFFSLSPSFPPPSLFSSPLFFPSHTLAPSLLFSLLLFVLPYSFLLRPPKKKLCIKCLNSQDRS